MRGYAVLVELIRPGGRRLFVHNGRTLAWTFPGGRAEVGDNGDLRRTAYRELREETGLELDLTDAQGVGRYASDLPEDRLDAVYLVARYVSDEEVDGVQLGAGIRDYRWLTPQEALTELPMLPLMINALRERVGVAGDA